MNAALHCVYVAVRERLPARYTFDQFAENFDGWDTVPLYLSGELVGGVVVRGNELHVGYSVSPRGSIRAHVRATLNAIIAEHGHAVTSVSVANRAGLRFCKRLGFREIERTASVVKLRCDRSNYV